MNSQSVNSLPTPILDLISKAWWLLLLRGIATLIFGILAFANPYLAVKAIIFYWSIFVLIDGIASLASVFSGGKATPKWWLILTGIVSVLAGIVCMSNPGLVANFGIMIIGWWCIFKGIIELIGAITLGAHGSKIWLIVAGLFSLLFGTWLVSNPSMGAAAFMLFIAILATIVGITLILLSLHLRAHSKSLPLTIDV